MNQRKDSAHHKRALKEARMAKLLFSFIALAREFDTCKRKKLR